MKCRFSNPNVDGCNKHVLRAFNQVMDERIGTYLLTTGAECNENCPEFVKKNITKADYFEWLRKIVLTSDEQMAKEASKFLDIVLNGRLYGYAASDWKDIKGLVDEVAKEAAAFNGKKFDAELFNQESADDIVIVMIEGTPTDDELQIVYNLVHEFNADLDFACKNYDVTFSIIGHVKIKTDDPSTIRRRVEKIQLTGHPYLENIHVEVDNIQVIK